MKAIEVACSYQHPTELWHCTAQPGEDCRMRSYLGNWYELTFFHGCRQAKAAEKTKDLSPMGVDFEKGKL